MWEWWHSKEYSTPPKVPELKWILVLSSLKAYTHTHTHATLIDIYTYTLALTQIYITPIFIHSHIGALTPTSSYIIVRTFTVFFFFYQGKNRFGDISDLSPGQAWHEDSLCAYPPTVGTWSKTKIKESRLTCC